MTKNQIDYWNLNRQRLADLETARSNRAREAETNRSNLSKERNERDRIANDLTLGRQKMSNESRSISETERSNKARESELRRSNQANEVIRTQENSLKLGNLYETMRSNQANEQIKRAGVLNDTRDSFTRQTQTNNAYSLGLLGYHQNVANLAEQRRLNTINAKLGEQRNRLLQQQNYNNMKRLQVERENNIYRNELTLKNLEEQERHNAVGEYISAWGTTLNAATRLGGKYGR